jgi:hypothetical protein
VEKKRRIYRSFIVRMWQEKGAERSVWRLMILDTETGARHGFNGFEKIAQFLQREAAQSESQNEKQEHNCTNVSVETNNPTNEEI